MVALSNYAEFVKASIEEGIDIIFPAPAFL